MSGPKIHRRLTVTSNNPAVKLLTSDRISKKRLLQRTGLSRKKWHEYYQRGRKKKQQSSCFRTENLDSEDRSVTIASCQENQLFFPVQSVSNKTTENSGSIRSLNENGTENQNSSDVDLQLSRCQENGRKVKKRKVTFELYALPLKKVRNKKTKDLFISLFGSETKIMTRDPSSSSRKDSCRLNRDCAAKKIVNTPCQGQGSNCGSDARILQKKGCKAPSLSRSSQSTNHDQCERNSNQGLSSFAYTSYANDAPGNEETSGQSKNNDKSNNKMKAEKSEENEVFAMSNSMFAFDEQSKDNLCTDSEVPAAASCVNCIDTNRKTSENVTPADSQVTPNFKRNIQNDLNEETALSENRLLESMEDEEIVRFHEDFFVSWIKEVKLIAHNDFFQCIKQNLQVMQNIKTACLSLGDKQKMLDQIQNHSSICRNLVQIFTSVVSHQNFQLIVICYFLRFYQQVFSKSGEVESFLPDKLQELKWCLNRTFQKSRFVNFITKKLMFILKNLNFEKSCARVWRVIRESLRAKDNSNFVEKVNCNEISECSSTVPAPRISVTDQIMSSANCQLSSKSNVHLRSNDSRGYHAQKNDRHLGIPESTTVDINERTTSKLSSILSQENSIDNVGNEPEVTRASFPLKENTTSAIESGKSLGESVFDKNGLKYLCLSLNVSEGVLMKYLQGQKSKGPAESPNVVKNTPHNVRSKCTTANTSVIDSQKENVPFVPVNAVNSGSSTGNPNGFDGQARHSSKHLSSVNPCLPQEPPQLLPLHESANSNFQSNDPPPQNLSEKRDDGNAVSPDTFQKIALIPSLPRAAPTPTIRRRRKKYQEVSGVVEQSSYCDQSARSSTIQHSHYNQFAPSSSYQMIHQTAAINKTPDSIASGTNLQSFQLSSQNFASFDASQTIQPSIPPPNLLINKLQQPSTAINLLLLKGGVPAENGNDLNLLSLNAPCQKIKYRTTANGPSCSQRQNMFQQHPQTLSMPPQGKLQLPITNQQSQFHNQIVSRVVGIKNSSAIMYPQSHSSYNSNVVAPSNIVFQNSGMAHVPVLSDQSHIPKNNAASLYPVRSQVPRKIGPQRRRSVQTMPSSETSVNAVSFTNSIGMNVAQQPLSTLDSAYVSKTNPASTSSSAPITKLWQSCSSILQTNSHLSAAGFPLQPQPLSVPLHSSSSNLTSFEPLYQLKLSTMPNASEINLKVTENSQYPSSISMQRASSNVATMREGTLPNIYVNKVISTTNNEGEPFSFHVRTANFGESATGTNFAGSPPSATNVSSPTHQPGNNVRTAATFVEQPSGCSPRESRSVLPSHTEKTPTEGNSSRPVTTGFSTIKKKPRVKYTECRPADQRRRNASIGKVGVKSKLTCNSYDDLGAESSNENLDKESDSSSSDLQIDLDFSERAEETDTVQSSLKEPQERLSNARSNALDNSKVPGIANNANVLKLLEDIDADSFNKDYVLDLIKKQCSSDKDTVNENVSASMPKSSEQQISQGTWKSSIHSSIPPSLDADGTIMSNALVNHSEAAPTVNFPEMPRSQEAVVNKLKDSRDEEILIASAKKTVVKHRLPASIEKPSPCVRKPPSSSKKNTLDRRGRGNASVNEVSSQSRNNSSKSASDQQQYEILNDPENMCKIVIATKNADHYATLNKSRQNVKSSKSHEFVRKFPTSTVLENSSTPKTTQSGKLWDSLHSLLNQKPTLEIEDALLSIYLELKGSAESDRVLDREASLNEANEYFKKHMGPEKICPLLGARLAAEQRRLDADEPRKRRILAEEIDAAKKAFILEEVSRNQVNMSQSSSTSSSQLTPPPTPTDGCSRKACNKAIAGVSYSCDDCRKVAYCSESCKKEDFFENHCNECERDDIF